MVEIVKKNKNVKKSKKTFDLVNALETAKQYHRMGNLSQAEVIYQQILQVDPHHEKVLHFLSVLAYQNKDYERTVELAQRAIALNKQQYEYYGNLGNALKQLERFNEAIDAYYQAAQLNPSFTNVYLDLGDLLQTQKRWDEAVTCYQQLLGFSPHHAAAHNDLGTAYLAQDRLEQALFHYQQAILYDNRLAQAYSNLGILFYRQKSYEEAIKYCRKALELDANLIEPHTTLVAIFQAQGKTGLAIYYLERQVALKPNCANLHSGLMMLLLGSGNFMQGWLEYVWRTPLLLNSSEPPTKVPLLPVNLQEQKVLVRHDQGLGDEIFFLRFGHILKARGAWIAYVCKPKIATILRRQSWIDQLIVEGESLEIPVNYTFLVGDMPLALGVKTQEQIPPPLSLSLLLERVARVREQLANFGPPPYLGLTWRAGTPKTEESKIRKCLYKEISLVELANILRPLQATFIVLQRNPQPEEIPQLVESLGKPVYDLSPLNEDLEEMLVLLSLLDEYIAVSNTNIHLLAGLGKTGRILVPYPPDWRWMLQGDESPWFKGFKIYRQTAKGDWSTALEQLQVDLNFLRIVN